jgi:glycosyltransferase involved in cell wall biosynthesis
MKRKIKVLHLITANLSGPYFRALADYTDRSQFDLTFGSLSVEGPLHSEMKSRGFETLALGCNTRSQWPRAVASLFAWLRRNRIEIMQTHLLEASLVGMSAAYLAGTPVRIFTGHHSHEVPLHSSRRLSAVDKFCARILANRVIAHCEQMRTLFTGRYGIPGEKVVTLPLPFDFSRWIPAPDGRKRIRSEFGLEGKWVFGAVGRFYWIKDYPTLFQAFVPIARKYPEAVLLVVGTGPDERSARELTARLGIQDRVIFTGYRRDIIDVMSAFDIFVHSALAESFCQVVVEALALGIPVVSTAVGIVEEVIRDGENGWVAPTGNPDAMNAALEALIAQRDRWPIMADACRRSVQRFHAPTVMASQQDLYRSWSA